MLTNCLEILVLVTNWTIWHLVVSQQACKISHYMNSSKRQTTSKVDFPTSPHKKLSSIMSPGKHGTALQTGFVPRLRLCWWSWGLKINLRRCLVFFWKQNNCPSELDVQEANVSVTQFFRIQSYFTGCWTSNGPVTRAGSLGHCDWGCTHKQRKRATQNHKPRETDGSSTQAY